MRTAASRRGSPAANSHPSTRRRVASPGGIVTPGTAGEAQRPFRRRPPVPDPPRHVGHGLVDADLGDLAAPVADGLGPGLADGRLAVPGQAGEALEDLDVAVVADGQLAERDRKSVV